MITENLSTLKINKLSQKQFNRVKAAGSIEANALYLTPDESGIMVMAASVTTNNGFSLIESTILDELNDGEIHQVLLVPDKDIIFDGVTWFGPLMCPYTYYNGSEWVDAKNLTDCKYEAGQVILVELLYNIEGNRYDYLRILNPPTAAVGEDGYSPVATVKETTDGAVITITDKNGTTSATITNGTDGKDGTNGKDGQDGTSVTVSNVAESTEDGGSNVVTFSDGKTITIKNGSKGTDGKDGTSVTVSKVNESTEDGGSSVVTFSDGKSVTIKNGSKGTDGKDGTNGKDGQDGEDGTSATHSWNGTILTITSASGTSSADLKGSSGVYVGNGVVPDGYNVQIDPDGEVIETLNSDEVKSIITDELAKHGQLKPEFANNVEECTDTTKLYVLPDGYIYACMQSDEVATPNFTNILDGTTLHVNKRYSKSAASYVDSAGHVSTDWLPVNKGDVVRFNVPLSAHTAMNCRIICKTSDGAIYWVDGDASYYMPITEENNGEVTSITFGTIYNTAGNSSSGTKVTSSNITHLMAVLHVDGITEESAKDIVITLNEEIAYTVTGGNAWQNTGHAFVPADYADYEDRIIGLETAQSNNERWQDNTDAAIAKLEAKIAASDDHVDRTVTNILDGTTLHLNKRYSQSSGGYVDAPGYVSTDLLTVEKGQIVRLNLPMTAHTATYSRLCTKLDGKFYWIDGDPTYYMPVSEENNGKVTSITFGTIYNTAGDSSSGTKVTNSNVTNLMAVLYISNSTITENDVANLIITLNEEIPADSNVEDSNNTDTSKVSLLTVGEIFAPSPQLSADGTEETDFNADSMTTQEIYDYLDVLCSKYPNYITKETLGKETSGKYDVNRYVLCKHYYSAWQQNNYPKMYAWVNGSTVIYSESISPRIGDTMYSTTYIGTSAGTVSVVNNANQTRTVADVIYTRDSSKDIEPTLVYTSIIADASGSKVYSANKATVTTISTIEGTTLTGKNGIIYNRYPMGDRDNNMTKLPVVTIGANEHGPTGDPREPAIVCARMIQDLCECRNADNALLNYLKNNVMLVMMPIINPFGFNKGSNGSSLDGYYNSNNVNINRNYDTPGWGNDTTAGGQGEYGGSEIETQYFMNTISEPESEVAI
jgi:hypothetical protein